MASERGEASGMNEDHFSLTYKTISVYNFCFMLQPFFLGMSDTVIDFHVLIFFRTLK